LGAVLAAVVLLWEKKSPIVLKTHNSGEIA
jgi:hypothetical protein